MREILLVSGHSAAEINTTRLHGDWRRAVGKYYNVWRTTDLEQALTDINEVEKGVFSTLSLT
jgi:hypothetical protein